MRIDRRHNIFSLTAVVAHLVALVLVSSAGAVPGQGPCKLDWAEQVTITGTVYNPKVESPCPKGVDQTLLYLSVVDDKGRDRMWQVKLGPTLYMEKHPIELNKGDTITVTGTPMADYALAAATVEHNGEVVALRDAIGRPVWRGARFAGPTSDRWPCRGGGRGWRRAMQTAPAP